MRHFPKLILLKKEGTGLVYPFPNGRCSIGGLPYCDIRMPSAGKSHCLLIVDRNGQAHVINVDGSSIQLNGTPVENEAFVNHKDVIKFGTKFFRFEWCSHRARELSGSTGVPADDKPKGAMRESSTLENGAGNQLHTDQESHGTPAASTSTASFLDQSVYKTPHIPPEEFVSPLTASCSNDSSRQSGANSLKSSLKRKAVDDAGQSATPVKRLSWSDVPNHSDEEPAKTPFRSRSRGKRPGSSLFVTPSQGLHAEDQNGVQAGLSNGQLSDSVPSTTSTPLIDEPRMRAICLRRSLANEGKHSEQGQWTPLAAFTSCRSDTDASMQNASSASHSSAKEQLAPHSSLMKKSVCQRSSVSRNSYSSSGDESFARVQDAATPSTSREIFAASTPVVPPALGTGQMQNGRAKTCGRCSSHQTNPNTPLSEATQSLRKTLKHSLGSGTMEESDPTEEKTPDASGSRVDSKVAGKNTAQKAQAIEAPCSSERSINKSLVSTPRVQRKENETGSVPTPSTLPVKSTPGPDKRAQKGSRSSCTPSVEGQEVETPDKKRRKEDHSFEHKNASPMASHSSHAASSKKSSGALEEQASPSTSSRISHASTKANGCDEAAHKKMVQNSFRSTRSGSLAGLNTAVDKDDSSQQEVDSPAKTPTAGRVPTSEAFSRSPVVALEKLVIPATTRASCTPLSAKANKDTAVKSDGRSLTGAAAAKQSDTLNAFDESFKDPLDNADDSVSSTRNTRASSTHSSTKVNEAEAPKPEAVQKSFRGSTSSSTPASKKTRDEAEASQQETIAVPIETPKANCKEKPSDSPVVARSTRGSGTPASQEQDTVVERSRASTAGPRSASKNRPEEDETREQDTTTVPEEPSDSPVVARSFRGSRMPASTNDKADKTPEQGAAVGNARGSSAGRRVASKNTLDDSDNSQQNSVSLPSKAPKANSQRSFEKPSDSPVVARTTRASRTPVSQEQSRASAAPEQGTTTVPAKTPKAGCQRSSVEELITPSRGTRANHTPISVKETTRETVQQEIGPRGSRRIQAGHTTALKNETSESVNVSAKTPEAGHQQNENEAAPSAKSTSQYAHPKITSTSTPESPKTVPKNRSSRCASTPASKNTCDEDETSQQEIVDVAAEKSQIQEPSLSAARTSSTPVLEKASRESGTPRSEKKETHIVRKGPCSCAMINRHSQASNEEPQKNDGNTEQPAESVGKLHRPRHEKSTDEGPEPLDNAEKSETGTSAKKARKAAATVSFGNEQAENELEMQEATVQSRAKRAAASKKQALADQHQGSNSLPSREAATPDKRKQDEAAAAPKMTTSRKTRGKRALASHVEASESELNTEENTASVSAKKRGGRVAASTSGLKVAKDDVGEGSPIGKTNATRATASERELNTEENNAAVPAKRKRGGRAAASTSDLKVGKEDMAEGSSMGKTRAAAPESELKTEESTAGIPAKRERGGRVAASTSGLKVDQDDMAEDPPIGKTRATRAAASESELNTEESTGGVPAKRKRGGRAAASTSDLKVDKKDMAEGSLMGKRKATREEAAEASHSAEAKSSRPTRATSSKQKKMPEAKTEPAHETAMSKQTTVEHQGGQAAPGPANVDSGEGATSSTLGRNRRKGAVATGELLAPTQSTPKKTRGRRAKALETIVDDEETGEPAADSPVTATEPRASKRATRRKV